eukprot:symbB.v1.2.003495.t1/scaffold197.1/size274157/2
MLFCHDPTNFDLSPRFVSKLVEGGSGVGLLQRAQDDVTHRAHQLWLETGRPDDKANWQDAERSLVHWRWRPDEVDSNDRKNESAKLESVALEELDFDFQHLSRRDLIDLCAAMQQNLRTAKSAFSSERSAVKALRKELQHERARVQRFSCKLMATESELSSRRLHQASNGDTLSPGEEWQFKGRTGNDILTERNGRCSSDCEACENRSRSRGESCLEMGDRPDFHAEFHDFPVGKCDDWCLDETVCPDGESCKALKSHGPLYDCYDPDEQDEGDSNLEDTFEYCGKGDFERFEKFDFTPKVWPSDNICSVKP